MKNRYWKILFFTSWALLMAFGCGGKQKFPNQLPLAVITAPAQANYSATVTLDGSASTDPEGDALTYHWQQISGAKAVLSSVNSATTTFVAPATGTMVAFQLIVNDGEDSSFAATAEITLTDGNRAPTADAGADQTVAEGATVTLLGSGADTDGDTLTYDWAQAAGEHVQLSDATAAQPTFTAPLLKTHLSFILTVSDGKGGSARDDVRVVVDATALPQARAGADQVALPGSTVTLDGSGSLNPVGGTMTYAWTQTSGPAVTLSAANVAKPTFTAPAQEVSLTFQLVVSAGGATSAADSITVIANTKPVAEAGVQIDAVGGTTVTLDGSASTDAESTALTYAWTQLAGPTVAISDPTAAKPTFVAPEQNGVLLFQLVVKDGFHQSDPDTVMAIVVFNYRPVANGGGVRTIPNKSTFMLKGTAVDPEGDPISGYEWTVTAHPIGGDNYQLPANQSPTVYFTPQVKGDYTLAFRAQDAGGWGRPDMVTVTASNNLPVASAGADRTVPNASMVILDGQGADADGDGLAYTWSVTTSPTGAQYDLQFATTRNARFTPRTKGTYVLQLLVNDGTANSLPDSVTITAVNSPPLVDAGQDFRMNEPKPVQLAATVSDPDGDNLTHVWTIQSTIPEGLGGTFSNTSSVSPTFTAEQIGTYTLALTANDGVGLPVTDTVKVFVELLPGDSEYIFVKTVGTDSVSCGTKAYPCKTLSQAVKLAGQQGKHVLMAGGDYVDPAPNIHVPPKVKIHGGFDPATWNRDIAQFKTTLKVSGYQAEAGALLTDGRDNDCDGLIDEAACVSSSEVCDNKDNDCDGLIDNDDDISGCGDTLEPNDTGDAATAIELNRQYKGMTISSTDTADWYRLNIGGLPPAGEEWVLAFHLQCYSSCSSTASRLITVEVFKGGHGAQNQIFKQKAVYDNGKANAYLNLSKTSAQTGDYYIKVSTEYTGTSSYMLMASFRAPGWDPLSTDVYRQVPPYCRDAHVMSFQGADREFVQGDENIVSGLTIYGKDVAMATDAPMTNFNDRHGVVAREWGGTLFCDGCALTVHDTTFFESQVKRREITAADRDASGIILLNSPKGYPILIENNTFQLGKTRYANGIVVYDADEVVIRNNKFLSSENKADTHVHDMRMIWGYNGYHGTVRLLIDANRFEWDTTETPHWCNAIRWEGVTNTQSHHMTPLYVTNNLFIMGGGCATNTYSSNRDEAFAPIWYDIQGGDKSGDFLVSNNSFFGAGRNSAFFFYGGDENVSTAIVNNYFQDFKYGSLSGYHYPYFQNNIFHNVEICGYVNYGGIKCDGADCATCLRNEFCNPRSTCRNGNPPDDGWASRDNAVAQCAVVNAAGGIYEPVAGTACVDRGNMSSIPYKLPQAPNALKRDHAGNVRPVDYPGAECPQNMSCDNSDVGAYELQ